MVPGSAIGEGWCCELKGAVPGRQMRPRLVAFELMTVSFPL